MPPHPLHETCSKDNNHADDYHAHNKPKETGQARGKGANEESFPTIYLPEREVDKQEHATSETPVYLLPS